MMVPCLEDISGSADMAKKYGCAFEFGDFVSGALLDNRSGLDVLEQRAAQLPNVEKSIVHGAFYDVTIFSSDPKIREVSELRVRQSIGIAQRLGARGVVFHTNYIPTFRVRSYMDAWVEDNRKFWIDMMGEYSDVDIYIENMFDLEPDLLQRLAGELSEYARFGVCLDIAHAHLSPVPIRQWIAALAPHIKHMHMNDNDRVADGHLPLGEGTIAFDEVFDALAEYNVVSPTILIEVSGLKEQKKCFEYLECKGII